MIKRILLLVLFLVALPVSLYLVLKTTNFFGLAGGTVANLLIDAGSSYDVPGGAWRNLAQGGEEKGRMLLPVVDKARSLTPSYIRIDHVFDAYEVVGRDGTGALTFNWSSLDATLSDIKAMGATPFISISYMPPTLSSSGSITDLPKNWGEWETAVQKLVEHVSGKAGLNVGGAYYEVWNEPDLFGGFKIGGQKNYLDLYLHTAIGARHANAVNPYKIGGPATTGLYDSWFNGLLNFCQRNSLPIDFYSWHRYSKSLSDFEKDYLNARTWLTNLPGFSNLELVVSELGPNSENDKVYDNGFSAIHTIATAAVLEGEVGKIFNFEIKDGPGDKKFWGRWGLFTHEKFGEPEAKPRVSAINFLNRMVGNKVNVAGAGSWVKAFAKEKNGVVRTLVVNYDPAGSHSEAVPMTFINLAAGPDGINHSFIFRRQDFGGGLREYQVATTSATWATVEGFDPNTAAIFEITPKPL